MEHKAKSTVELEKVFQHDKESFLNDVLGSNRAFDALKFFNDAFLVYILDDSKTGSIPQEMAMEYRSLKDWVVMVIEGIIKLDTLKEQYSIAHKIDSDLISYTNSMKRHNEIVKELQDQNKTLKRKLSELTKLETVN